MIEHIPSNFSISTIPSLKRIENKYDIHRSKDYVKKVCESLGVHAMEVIN